MKKVLAVLLILALALSLCACQKTPEQLLAAAGEALAEKKYTEAVDYLNELLVQEPENIEALSALAETYTAMGDNANAEATLSTLTALQPDNADFVARLADMYLANGKNTEALAQYDKLVELGGTPSDELYELWLSTPLFDIQDEAVFNHKVDELFSRIGGMEFKLPDEFWEVKVDNREQVETFILVMNLENISLDQARKFKGIEEKNICNFYFKLANLITNYNVSSSDDFISLKDYVSLPKDFEIIDKLETVVNDYIAHKDLTEEDKKFTLELVQNCVSDVKYETQNSIVSSYCYECLCFIDGDSYTNTGNYFYGFDDMYSFIESENIKGSDFNIECQSDLSHLISIK